MIKKSFITFDFCFTNLYVCRDSLLRDSQLQSSLHHCALLEKLSQLHIVTHNIYAMQYLQTISQSDCKWMYLKTPSPSSSYAYVLFVT